MSHIRGMPVRADARLALLVLGMQNEQLHPTGFFPRNGYLTLAPADRSDLLARIGRLADAMRQAGRPVIHGQWAFRSDYLDCHFSPQWRRLGLQAQGAFVKHTPGAAFVEELQVGEDDFVLPMVSHSAFQFTALDRLLRNCGVEACVVVGGAADESVDDTTRQGAAHGYRMLLVPEAIYPFHSPHLATLRTRAECVPLANAVELGPDRSRCAPSMTGQVSQLLHRHARPGPSALCLVIVDIMNDFIKPEGAFGRLGYYPLAADEVRVLIDNNVRLLAAFRAAARPVVHIRGEYRADGLDAAWAWVNQRQDAPGMVHPIPPDIPFKLVGTWGAQIIDELAPEDSEVVVVKKGHSGFGFTELDPVLRRLGVDACVMSGGASEGCLSDTVREGAGYGYEMLIVGDAAYRAHHPVLATLARQYGALVTTAEVLDALGQPVASRARDQVH